MLRASRPDGGGSESATATVPDILTGSGSRAALTSTGRSAGTDRRQPHPLTLDLGGLGRYRVLAAPSRNGHDVIVTGGLSMGATILQMLIIFRSSR